MMIRNKPYTSKLITQRARKLRNAMTKEENHLWYDFLRRCGWKFNRQYPVGNYIVDFYCAEAALIIEIDGGQHYTEEARLYDAQRTRFLESIGLTVIRIQNRDIWQKFPEWCQYIRHILAERTERDPG